MLDFGKDYMNPQSQNQSIIYIPCPTRCTTDYLNPWISPVVHVILAGLCSAPLLWKAEICFLWEFRAKFKASEVWRRFTNSSLYFKAVHVLLEVNLTLWRDALIGSWNFLSQWQSLTNLDLPSDINQIMDSSLHGDSVL